MDSNQILDKYTNNFFEIQTERNGYFLYFLTNIDFIPKDPVYDADQLYLIFESADVKGDEILIEINLGVDVMASFGDTINHFKKTIRVECSEPDFEFSETSCILLKKLLDDIIIVQYDSITKESIDSIKTMEPYYINNIRFTN